VNTRATDLQHALRLSAFSIVWSGVAGSIAVYAALVSGSLSLLGFGADAVIDSVASIVLVWRFSVETRQPHRAERADSILTAVAAILAAISLASLAASQAFGLWWADAIAALIVGIIVLREGWSSLSLAETRRFGH
jgi:divalent metal cation (Fe/Co/Zn/Cd) transporter